jgi:peptidoglycan/LPS O-acetylase OafA/YrhL
VSSLLYVSNYYQAIFGDPNTAYSHTWSLGIEEQFYLLWPVCFIALRLHARRIAGLAILIGTVWLYRVVLQFGFGVDQSYIYEAFDTRADHLAVGCLLALLLRGGMWADLWSWLSRPWMSLATVALLIFSNMLGYSFGYPYRDTVGFAIDPILIAVLIIQVIALRDSALWSWLNWAPVRYLGAMSYSIYLYQQVVIGRAQQTFAWMPAAIQLTATVSIVLLVAAVSYHLIERPFLRSKKLAAQSLGVRRITPGPMGSGESLIGA